MPEPSLRVTHVHRRVEHITTGTQYILGRNTRFESDSGGRITNHDLHLGFELDFANRTYTAFPANRFGSPKWSRSVRTKPLKKSGRTTHYHFETIDTGERKEWFGYTARHVITKTTTTRDSELSGESEDDGWYIDPPAAWLLFSPPPKPGTFSRLVAGSEIDDCKATFVGERETGFAVLVKRRSKSFHRMRTGEMKIFEDFHEDEVTEFSESPLERSLFVPPPGFKRVAWLRSSMRYRLLYRIRLRWEFFKLSFTLSRRIAHYLR